MKLKASFAGFALITAAYLGALVVADSRNETFSGVSNILAVLPLLMGASFVSYVVRYIRWHWLMARRGNQIQWLPGFLAYLSGFAFTATPGKVGELVRIRYFEPQGVPPHGVFAAFVYERAFDLIAVLAIASLAASGGGIFSFVAGFVAVFLGAVALAVFDPSLVTRVSVFLRRRRLLWASRVAMILSHGFSGCRLWLTPLDAFISLVMGLVAWGITAFSFVYLLEQLGVLEANFPLLAVYPLAMLAGAASMLPGGLGSTEVTIVALLSSSGVALAVATLAAVGIRLATLWFSIVCGFIAIGILELRPGVLRPEKQ